MSIRNTIFCLISLMSCFSTQAMLRNASRMAVCSRPVIARSVSFAQKKIIASQFTKPVTTFSNVMPARTIFSASKPVNSWRSSWNNAKWAFKNESDKAQELFDAIQDKILGNKSQIFINSSVHDLIGLFPKKHINDQFLMNGAKESLLTMAIKQGACHFVKDTIFERWNGYEQERLIKSIRDADCAIEVGHLDQSIEAYNAGAFKVIMRAYGDARGLFGKLLLNR